MINAAVHKEASPNKVYRKDRSYEEEDFRKIGDDYIVSDQYKKAYATTVDPALLARHYHPGNTDMRQARAERTSRHPDTPAAYTGQSASGGAYHVRNFETAVLDNGLPKGFRGHSGKVRRNSTLAPQHGHETPQQQVRMSRTGQHHVESFSPFAQGASGVAMKLLQALTTVHPMPDPTKSAEYVGRSLADIAASSEDYVGKYAQALLQAEEAAQLEAKSQMIEARRIVRKQLEQERREQEEAIREQLQAEIAFAREQEKLLQIKERALVAALVGVDEEVLLPREKAQNKPPRPGSGPPVSKRGKSNDTKVRPTSSKAFRRKVAEAGSDAHDTDSGAERLATDSVENAGLFTDIGSVGSTTDVVLSAEELEDINRLLTPLELKQLKRKLQQHQSGVKAAPEPMPFTPDEAVAPSVHSAEKEPTYNAPSEKEPPAVVPPEPEPEPEPDSIAHMRKDSAMRMDAVLQHLAMENDSIASPIAEHSEMDDGFSVAGTAVGTLASSSVRTMDVLREYLGETDSSRRPSSAVASAPPVEPLSVPLAHIPEHHTVKEKYGEEGFESDPEVDSIRDSVPVVGSVQPLSARTQSVISYQSEKVVGRAISSGVSSRSTAI